MFTTIMPCGGSESIGYYVAFTNRDKKGIDEIRPNIHNCVFIDLENNCLTKIGDFNKTNKR